MSHKISPLLGSQPSEAAPEEVLCHPPHEAWPLARVLNALSMKMGRTDPLAQPRHRLQAGKSGDPHSQNADSSPRAQGALGLGFEAKPKGKCGVPQAPQPAALVDAWRLIGRGRLRFPMLPRQLPDLTSPCCMQGKTIITCDRGDRRLALSCYK